LKLLAFSDLHRDLGQAETLVAQSTDAGADVVAAVGDFASVHSGLEETVGALAAIDRPTLLVPGNNETEDALRKASAGWAAATVLHGEATEVEGTRFFGLGAGVPTTPWDWSFDLDEDEATAKLGACPEGAIMLVHSPPYGHCDVSGAGVHLGSNAILQAIERTEPPLVLCGHIHESWGTESSVGPSRIVNLGPEGRVFEL
jgi:Icc-related predicted phosphoesterase